MAIHLLGYLVSNSNISSIHVLSIPGIIIFSIPTATALFNIASISGRIDSSYKCAWVSINRIIERL